MARGRINRAVLVETTLGMVDEGGVRGLDDLTLAAVAARLGVSAPSLYKHIASLSDLRREVAIASVRELTRELGEAIIGRAGEAAVVALVETMRSYAERHPGRYMAIQHAVNPDDPADAELVEAAGRSISVIAGALRSYDFTPDQNIDAIRALRSAIHGFVLLELEGGFGIPRHPDTSFEVLTRMLLTGLAELGRQN